MDEFHKIKDKAMSYDPEKDGVWLYDGNEAVVFMPRNVIIGMLGYLTNNPPRNKT